MTRIRRWPEGKSSDGPSWSPRLARRDQHMTNDGTLLNYVGGQWTPSASTEISPIHNPATGDRLAAAPLSSAADVGHAVRAAQAAFATWRQVPPGDRIQPLFRLKTLLDSHFQDLARVITLECGKT